MIEYKENSKKDKSNSKKNNSNCSYTPIHVMSNQEEVIKFSHKEYWIGYISNSKIELD